MQGKGVKQRVHSGSCPRLPGMHIGFTWAGVLGGRGEDFVSLGKVCWQVSPRLSSLGVGEGEMGSLRRLSFMRLVPWSGSVGEGGGEGVHVH